MSEAWSQWQGQVIDGKFHLQQFLGGSGQSGVFLARIHTGQAHVEGSSEAGPVAIRLIADSPNAELQLSRWRMAQGVSYPRLLRILETGRCRLGEIDLIYAVMEYGEETLAQIVPERPLTVQETCDMLEPVLETLTYLHARGLVHAHLKPANIMAISDELKLAADGIMPADQPVSSDEGSDVSTKTKPGASAVARSIYDAPETAAGAWAPAADVWSLGATLAEILTQRLPSVSDPTSQSDPLLPGNLPVQFVEIVRGCLRRDLRLRWTLPAIRARLNAPVPQPAPAVQPQPVPEARLDVPPAVADAASAIKFSDALRSKPVVSQRAIVTEKPLARAASAGANSVQVGEAQTAATVAPARERESMRPRAASLQALESPGSAQKAEALPANDSTVVLPFRTPKKPATSDLIRKTQAAIATNFVRTSEVLRPVIAQTSVATRRIVEQSRISTRLLSARAGRATLAIAAHVEGLLRRIPARNLRRLVLPLLALSVGLSTLYLGWSMMRHKPSSQSAHQAKTPAPRVVIIKQQEKPAGKGQPSAAPAKPHPGSRQSATQAPPSPAVQPETQSSAQPGQPPAQQPVAQPVSMPSNSAPSTRPADAQSSVRRIDDGGADANSDDKAPARTAEVARNGNVTEVANPGVTQPVVPHPPMSALHTIHGTVRVSVKVKVDRSGNVARAELASPGPSRYFARLSLEAAQNWKFASGQSSGSPFLLHFEFKNSGARAFATRVGS